MDDATRRQVEAARPDANTWLSANAGSGKTRVLTDRVARLLLSGVPPQNILCLTYTKAAAREMQNRLFDRLGTWTMMDTPVLLAELARLGTAIDERDLGRARKLFAQAIETPGGLKIQTIHAFCASILRRFPMESGVNPNFQEMDDRSALLLQDEILQTMSQGAARPLFERVARYFTGAEISELTVEIAGNAKLFRDPADPDAIARAHGIAPGLTEQDIPDRVFQPGSGDLIHTACEAMMAGSATLQGQAAHLMRMDLKHPGPADLSLFQTAVLTKSGTIAKNLSTKAIVAALGEDHEDFIALCQAAEEALGDQLAIRAAERSRVLHDFAHAFVRDYDRAKAERGWLDFDDLIELTSRLLTSSEVAQWVLFRLEGGIDHILVDEAQDTSPDQWRIIRALADEFMSGDGLHAQRDWSVFVVGDPKQSIYSFQGADPAEFARVRDDFSARLDAVSRPLAQLPLEHSFRSSPAILTAVDRVLADQTGLGDTVPLHRAFHDQRPGRVDLWPVIEKVEKPKPNDWHDPVDLPSPDDQNVLLARAIAREIARMIEEEQLPHGDGFRPVEPRDILVLVQGRSALFRNIISACKSAGIPIAGADRLRIGGEMAVKDLTALLSFLATPEDDLSLAALLRSPLFGWTEDALYRLAQPREGYLWRALRDHGDSAARTVLQDLLDQSDYLRPYDLLERALTRHDGRRLLVGRLGKEAVDGIDALLAQALNYEQVEVPSLTGFLTWVSAHDLEVKRQIDSQQNEMRVMTVHGAKGLEAPIVFLPETTVKRPMPLAKIAVVDGVPVWRTAAADTPPAMREDVDEAKARAADEKNRLLYVAMTRAESWLIIAGAGETADEPGKSWHDTVRAGLSQLDCQPFDSPVTERVGEPGLRFQTGDWPPAAPREIEARAQGPVTLPDWMTMPPPAPPAPPKVLTPSDLGGAKILFRDLGVDLLDDPEDAKRRGRQIHRLLEVLPAHPPGDWDRIAPHLLGAGVDAAGEDEIDGLLSEARAILDNPDLATLFVPDALAEVTLSAPTTMAGAARIIGTVDRLILTPTRVTVVDFKTNAVVPDRAEDTPAGILRQMGAYAEAVGKIYPDREVALAILWTRAATLMDIPVTLAGAAFSMLDATDADT